VVDREDEDLVDHAADHGDPQDDEAAEEFVEDDD
jgi:hypothetical protein